MKSILIPSLVAALLSPAIAFASDGAINFNGSVVETTCTYTGDGSKSQTVNLPAVSASSLSAAGATAGDTAFDVRLEKCAQAEKVAVHLEGGAADYSTGNLSNTATTNFAEHVAVQLADRNTNTAIRIPGASATVVAQADGSAVIPLLAKYVASAPAKAGSVTSSVNFSIVYP